MLIVLVLVFFFLCRPMLRMYNMTLTVTDTDGYGSMPKLVTGILL